MNINYKDTPFPYFYGSLDKKMYDYAHKLWSTDEDLKSYNPVSYTHLTLPTTPYV